jgi:hypothetical protein
MNDPRLPARDVSWMWSWMTAKEGKAAAGVTTVIFPVVALSAAVALAFIPFTVSVAAAKFLFLTPLPALLFTHLKGRRGLWSIVAMLIAALPYVALIAGVFMKGEPNHIPL